MGVHKNTEHESGYLEDGESDDDGVCRPLRMAHATAPLSACECHPDTTVATLFAQQSIEEAYFNPKTGLGFIRNCLNTMRTHVPKENLPSSRVIVAGVEKTNLTTESADILKRKVQWMIDAVPTRFNKEEISQCLKDTVEQRRALLLSSRPSEKQTSPVAGDVLGRYPKLLAYDGDMLDEEFSRIHPEHREFLVTFPQEFTSFILKYAASARPDLRREMASFENRSQFEGVGDTSCNAA